MKRFRATKKHISYCLSKTFIFNKLFIVFITAYLNLNYRIVIESLQLNLQKKLFIYLNEFKTLF